MEKPILFSTEMVRAILEDRKTQTRRVIKMPRHISDMYETDQDLHRNIASINRDGAGDWIAWEPAPMTDEETTRLYPDGGGFPCPYGHPGDTLWVRETWATINRYDHLEPSDIPRGDVRWPSVWYYTPPTAAASAQNTNSPFLGKKRQSIFMPRWASRLTLKVIDVRVERVQGISEEDARDEGVSDLPDNADGIWCARDRFMRLWDSINEKRGYPWSSNPWVWVIEFKKMGD